MPHTPGPWRVHPKSGHVCIEAGWGCRVIADVGGIAGDTNPDARLIAHAPAILDSLRALVAWADYVFPDSENKAWDDARALLRAVEG